MGSSAQHHKCWLPGVPPDERARLSGGCVGVAKPCAGLCGVQWPLLVLAAGVLQCAVDVLVCGMFWRRERSARAMAGVRNGVGDRVPKGRPGGGLVREREQREGSVGDVHGGHLKLQRIDVFVNGDTWGKASTLDLS